MKEFLLEYVRYNKWANQKFTEYIIQNCTEEQSEKEIKSSFSSVKKTLLHIWGAESIWLQRLQGDSAPVWKGSGFSGSAKELCEQIEQTEKDFISFVESCGEAFLLSPFHYKNLAGEDFQNTRADAIIHCVNHSTYHRGQLTTMLRQLDFTKLFSTDYISYCRERALQL